MSTYVLSDIHGQYDAFMRMLKKIKFSNKDILYILGDVIDRGPESLKILDYIMDKSNIYMIKGNHEEMMIKYYNTKNIKDYKLWKRNGGLATLKRLEEISLEQQEIYLKYLRKLPLLKKIEVQGKEYLLVHAGIHPSTNMEFLNQCLNENEEELLLIEEDVLWIRYEFLLFKNYIPYDIVFGHTPTIYLPEIMSKIPDEIIDGIINSKIVKWQNKIGIDCGCAGEIQLGCLRLDDMKEFYVKC